MISKGNMDNKEVVSQHLKPFPTKCKHKITVVEQKLICAYCGEPIKL
jgi:hypothetical protein